MLPIRILVFLLLIIAGHLHAQAPAPTIGIRPDPATAAIKALVAGSRWGWFDSLDFTGKEYWAEFYRDGTGRTSWGTGHTWDIIPPSILHFYQPGDKRHWYFDIDVAKKVGTKNAEKDTNHNSIRYDKRVNKPPSNKK